MNFFHPDERPFGDTWCIDSTVLRGLYINNRPSLHQSPIALTTVIDLSSLLVLGWSIDIKRPTPKSIVHAIQMARDCYEQPVSVLTDNGSEYEMGISALRNLNVQAVRQSRLPKDVSFCLESIQDEVEFNAWGETQYRPDETDKLACKVAECIHTYNKKKRGCESPQERYDRKHLGKGYACLLEARTRLADKGTSFATHEAFLNYVIEKGLEAL